MKKNQQSQIKKGPPAGKLFVFCIICKKIIIFGDESFIKINGEKNEDPIFLSCHKSCFLHNGKTLENLVNKIKSIKACDKYL